MTTGVEFNEEQIFDIARRIESEDLQQEYVSQVCAADPALRMRVDELLRLYREEQSFLELPPQGLAQTCDAGEVAEHSGDTIGPYRLLQKIGEGGFGVVYMAEQTRPVNRKVALKVIKPGMDTREVVARFEAERQALAMMNHPNIAKVLDGGETEKGRPYFVMELVRGVPITQFCDEQKLTNQDRLKLFITVCGAIQHAHQKGVIHRDIKPSNVMITLHDGEPVPKVIDFGVSKAINQRLTEKTLFTCYGQMVGTPQYMSPEQAEMSGLDVDTRSDIYSLGVMLYELLTGTTPLESERLRAAGYAEIQRLIRDDEPPKPSTRVSGVSQQISSAAEQRRITPEALRRSLRGDLDWVVMKALDKDRNRRYETATGLAKDVLRYLDSKPVHAGPPTATYRLQKFIVRNRGAVASAAIVVASLLIGLGFALTGLLQANQARAIAETSAEKAIGEATKANMISSVLTRALVESTAMAGKPRDYTVPELLDDVFQESEVQLIDQPEARAEILLTLAKCYWHYDQHEQAQACTDRVMALAMAGKLDHELHGKALVTEASVRGDLQLSRNAHEFLVEHGIQGKTLAESKKELCYRLIKARKDYAQAEQLGYEAFVIAKGQPGPEDEFLIATTAGKLAYISYLRGKFSKAAEVATEGRGQYDNIEYAWNLTVATDAYLALGKIDRARETAEECLTRMKQFQNPFAIGHAYFRLAGVSHAQGKFKETQRHLQDAKQSFRESPRFKPQSPGFWGRYYVAMGDYEQAENEFREILNDDTHRGSFYGGISLLLLPEHFGSDDPEIRDRDEVLRNVNELSRLPDNDPLYAAVALALLDPESVSLQAWSNFEKELPGRLNDVGTFALAWYYYQLGHCQAYQGNLLEAQQSLECIAEKCGEAWRAEVACRYSALESTILEKLRATQDEFQAEQLLNVGLECRKHHLAPKHPQIAFAQLRLAAFLHSKREYAKAAELAAQAHEILEEHELAPPEHAKAAATQLVDIYTAWGKPESAKKWERASIEE